MDFEDMDISVDDNEPFHAIGGDDEHEEDWDALREMMELDDAENGVFGEAVHEAVWDNDDYWEDWDGLRQMMDLDDAENVQFGGAPRDLPPVADHLSVVPHGRMVSGKYGLTFDRYKITINKMQDVAFDEIIPTMMSVLQHIIDVVLANVGERDIVRLRIETESLDIPIWTPPMLKSQLTLDRWMAEVQKVLNSQQAFKFDDSFNIIVSYATPPGGAAIDNVPTVQLNRLSRSTSIVVIKNKDDICMARAIVVGVSRLDVDRATYKKMQDARNNLQKNTALELIQRAGLPVRAYDIADAEAFQAVLPGYQLSVCSANHLNSFVYNGPPGDKRIVLYHHSDHFDLLTSLPGFFKRTYWCNKCDKGYDNRMQHRCEHRCPACLRLECPREEDDKIRCPECDLAFNGVDCFNYHKSEAQVGGEIREALCNYKYRCPDCRKTVNTRIRGPYNIHRCNDGFCRICCSYQLKGHKCYMRQLPFTTADRQRHQEARFLFFDFETYVDEETGRLIPNMAVVQDDQGEEEVFPAEDERFGRDISDDLCRFIFQDKHKGFYVIGHNFRASDGYFILKWLVNNGIMPKLIMNGSKIIQLDVEQFHIHFRDSLTYNPQSLAKWPATFGLQCISKRTFSHRLNRPDNWNLTELIEYPSLSDFGFHNMPESDKPAFLEWYNQDRVEKNNQYDVQKEMFTYCRMDVTVLRLCCQQFRELYMTITNGLCPFVSAATIAGVCSVFWRANCLEQDQIAIMTSEGQSRLQSVVGVQWMEWTARQLGIDIDHRGNGHEKKIGKFFVDGYCKTTNQVFEFYGCFCHGCPLCFPPDTLHPLRNQTMKEVYNDTMARQTYLEGLHFDVVTCWECQFKQESREDEELRDFLKECVPLAPLHPRDAFFGGRTNGLKLHHEVGPGEHAIVLFCFARLLPSMLIFFFFVSFFCFRFRVYASDRGFFSHMMRLFFE